MNTVFLPYESASAVSIYLSVQMSFRTLYIQRVSPPNESDNDGSNYLSVQTISHIDVWLPPNTSSSDGYGGNCNNEY